MSGTRVAVGGGEDGGGRVPPRLPTICTVVVIGEPVELVNVSTVRAKSSLPVLGTVTSRLTVRPAIVPLAVTTLCPPSAVL